MFHDYQKTLQALFIPINDEITLINQINTNTNTCINL